MGQTDTGQTARRKDGKGEWLMNTQGLTSAQAVARLSQVGENRLAAKKQASVAAMFFSQFKDVMILILAAATLISVLMGQGAEAVTIIAIVLLNAVMGFLQEYRTEQTLEALKELSAPTARVRRDGAQKTVSARTVVRATCFFWRRATKLPQMQGCKARWPCSATRPC